MTLEFFDQFHLLIQIPDTNQSVIPSRKEIILDGSHTINPAPY